MDVRLKPKVRYYATLDEARADPELCPICPECHQANCPVDYARREAAKGNMDPVIERYLRDGHNYG